MTNYPNDTRSAATDQQAGRESEEKEGSHFKPSFPACWRSNKKREQTHKVKAA